MNANTTIDDTMLSAWLDGELPPQDMARVRAAIDADPQVAERVAALRSVNALVLRHARALDEAPLPASVLRLLSNDAAAPVAPETVAAFEAGAASPTVVQGPWQRWSRATSVRLAVAASLVLALGLVLTQPFGPLPAELPPLAAYATHLDASPSGSTVPVEGATLTPRFTFTDRDGRFCRQFQLNSAGAGSENVACREVAGWTLVASLPTQAQAAPELYQAASSSAELNALLDAMMEGPALAPDVEAALIDRGWRGE